MDVRLPVFDDFQCLGKDVFLYVLRLQIISA